MVSDSDMKVITPKPINQSPSAAHIESGVPVPKAMRVRMFSPDDWEEFVEEWAASLSASYQKVRRFGGAGDLGVDVAGFSSAHGFKGDWDNYQCKRYDHPLRPSDAWVEIGKIIYYSFCEEYIPPKQHFFVCSQGIGTKFEKLLNDIVSLKQQSEENWVSHCQNGITSTKEVKLEGELKKYFDAFDFSIFKSKSHVELINEHQATSYHTVRFGGGLPPRPNPDSPPSELDASESRYVRQLLDAYGDYLGRYIPDTKSIESDEKIKLDFLRQRERFYHAESLRNFARDTVPEGTFSSLQDEIFHGVIDVVEQDHANGFERMKSAVIQSTQVAATSNPLASATKAQDRQGICHQLANEDRLKWLPDDD